MLRRKPGRRLRRQRKRRGRRLQELIWIKWVEAGKRKRILAFEDEPRWPLVYELRYAFSNNRHAIGASIGFVHLRVDGKMKHLFSTPSYLVNYTFQRQSYAYARQASGTQNPFPSCHLKQPLAWPCQSNHHHHRGPVVRSTPKLYSCHKCWSPRVACDFTHSNSSPTNALLRCVEGYNIHMRVQYWQWADTTSQESKCHSSSAKETANIRCCTSEWIYKAHCDTSSAPVHFKTSHRLGCLLILQYLSSAHKSYSYLTNHSQILVYKSESLIPTSKPKMKLSLAIGLLARSAIAIATPVANNNNTLLSERGERFTGPTGPTDPTGCTCPS